MIVKLDKPHFDYLKANLFNSDEGGKLEVKIRNEKQIMIIEVGEETADRIRDWANDEIHRKGFDVNYELTLQGKVLEELADSFFVR